MEGRSLSLHYEKERRRRNTDRWMMRAGCDDAASIRCKRAVKDCNLLCRTGIYESASCDVEIKSLQAHSCCDVC